MSPPQILPTRTSRWPAPLRRVWQMLPWHAESRTPMGGRVIRLGAAPLALAWALLAVGLLPLLALGTVALA